MRPIKFRGYNHKNKQWLHGCYLLNRGMHFVAPDGIADPQKTWEDFEIDPTTIGQYTGRNDKNGMEIYEGDRIRCTAPNWKKGTFRDFVVSWSEQSGMFTPMGLFDDYIEIEVIGNVHEQKYV